MTRRRLGRSPFRAAAGLGVLALTLAGCGSGSRTPADDPGERAGGSLTIAVARTPASDLDPLRASDPATAAVSRQIHEPLMADVRAPLGSVRHGRGLAVKLTHTPDRREWTVRLRRGVTFQNGAPLTARAVVANTVRWRVTATGRRLLPGLAAADAPRNSVLRLVFDRAVPDVARRLRSPRLGIVAPASIAASSFGRSGTGPMELRERTPGQRVVMARNRRWWGTHLRLGPALDRVVFAYHRTSRERLAAVEGRQAQVAMGLSRVDLERASRDPLLEVVRGAHGGALALERSVRGVRPPLSEASLSEAWLTRVAL